MRRRTDVTWRIGTIGFSYSPWRGVFYPPGSKPNEYLAYYASRFDSVELDTTFHAMPTLERVRAWAEQVDEQFRFVVKTPKMITHEGPIEQRVDLMRAFADVVRGFEQKLGMVLLQFPPTFEPRETSSLMKMLDRVRDVPLAVEFRNNAWFAQGTVRLFDERGVTVVANDYLDQTQPLISRQPMFLRFIGEHDRFSKYDEEELDMTERLQWWIDQVEKRAAPNATVYAMFNNDYAGYSVGTGDRLKDLLSLAKKRTDAMVSLFE